MFDFTEEDEVTNTYDRWCKFSNPNSQDPTIKYQFLQYASTTSISQMKGGHTVGHVHVVAIDDDDHGYISDVTPSPTMLKNASAKQLEELDAISDEDLVEHCVNPESSRLDIGINVSRHFRSSGENGLISSIVPDSPSSNGSVDARTPDSHDTVLENFPSTSTSPVKENNIARDIQVEDQPVCSLETEETETIVLHTDYVTYCNRYYPAPLLLFSKNCVRVKASSLEDESGACRLEWEIDDIVSIESHWSSVASMVEVKLQISTRDAGHDGYAQDTSVVEVLEFLVCDPRWPWRQECIMSLDTRYKTAWSIGLMGEISHRDAFLVDNSERSSYPYIPIFEKPFEEVVYPEGDVDAVSLSKRDVELLQPETFINDTIIDFYIKYLKNQIPPQERHRFHFFNSFFFRKLADLDKNQSSAFDSKAAFQRVHKWTRKVDIFEKDYLFIPVNYSLHWSLIVICYPGEAANLNCESNDESLKVPCILHMDSIRGSHTGLKDLVQSYLLEEWKERRKETSEDFTSNFLNLRFLSLELPQQENCSDCGLFLLHYVELFIAEAPANFNPFMISNFENFLKPDWFMPAEASLKRVHIQKLIYKLLESRSLGSTPSCHQESHPLTQPDNNKDHSIEIISQNRSLRRSWNPNLSHSQSVQGIGTGLLDMSLFSTLRMRDLEHSQHYDQGESSEQLQCQNPLVREEIEAEEHVGCSSLVRDQLQLVHGAFHSNYGFSWNSESSDHEEPEGNSSPMSNCSSDDSQDMEIIESDPEKRGAILGQSQNLDHPKENVDNLTESYNSASSEIMETPGEDSQEINKVIGSNHQDQEEEQLNPNQEEVLRSQSSDQDYIRDENDGVLVVQDSSSDSDSDEEQAAKRIRLSEESETERSLSEEV